MGEKITINILISTIDEGIERVKNVILNPKEDVQYIISHQFTDPGFKYVPHELERDDILISHIPGQGVSTSRNHAIGLANGTIGLFSDDDVTYRDSDIENLRDTFHRHKDVDIALFKVRTPPGDPPYNNNYPKIPTPYSIKLPVSTVQIAFRVDRVKDNNLLFDERFGAGQKLLIGAEERIFLHDCVNSGLKITYFPEYVVEHPYESTIKTIKLFDRRRNSVTGGYDARVFGWIAIPKAFMGTIKFLPDLIKNRINPFSYFYYRLRAAMYILFTSPNGKKRNEIY